MIPSFTKIFAAIALVTMIVLFLILPNVYAFRKPNIFKFIAIALYDFIVIASFTNSQFAQG